MDYDVIVVGGGHAGLEAAFSAAHMGAKTLLVSINKAMMGNMPCNPSIGGSAKGIVVREIDALGGMMGKTADLDYLQMKMLNTGKGPGVRCLRAQEDKLGYPHSMQDQVDKTENLDFLEGIVSSLLFSDQGIGGIRLESGAEVRSKTVILATGTYMDSDILVGHERTKGGPDGEKPSIGLSAYLRDQMGIGIYRLKTGTPPRLKRSSIDFSKMLRQDGGPEGLAFSYETTSFIPVSEQVPCYLAYTNEKTHALIREHLGDSSLYGGMIHSLGPRYCPSIETKVVQFKDKERHQLFLEPESRDTESIYIQGLSTSMPKEIQVEMVHTIKGLEHAEFLKYAYAIEYDAIQTGEYDSSLMIRKYPGLYCAGQICGTSGYEEAAALGLMAGINAVLRIRGEEPFVLKRDEAYIGVMIDDLVTKGTVEPYRLMSSRAEFRLLLRHDNADLRLSEFGYRLGLIGEERHDSFVKRKDRIERAVTLLKSSRVKEKDAAGLSSYNAKAGSLYSDFLKLPGTSIVHILDLVTGLSAIGLSDSEREEVETCLRYEGYINNQKKEAANMRKLESLRLDPGIDYLNFDGLALEARQKLDRVRPATIGQASRISGVNPADIAVLIMKAKKEKENGR